ncbi:MAG: hypothetical protein K1000chlam4_00380 [Chlamydiae bacterium]|nr:hypothetical protein [Chlamydiota bacterium]
MTAQVSNSKGRFWNLEGVKPKIQISQQLSKRIDYSSYLGPAVREALRLQSDALAPSRKISAIRFHLIRGQNHLLLELVLRVNRSSRPKNIIKLEDAKVMDFQQVNVVFPLLSSQEQFLNALHDFPTIEIDSNERVRGVPEVANTELQYPAAPLPKAIFIGNNRIVLSHECLDGLKGKRGADHIVEVPILEKCLSKKIKKLKTLENNTKHAFDFRVQSDGENKVLNLVCAKKNMNTFAIITAYYPTDSIVECRTGLVGDRLQAYINNLPKVEG